MENALGIYKKMHEVMKRVAYLEKAGKNTQQGYKYLSERQIKEEIHKTFVELGVVPHFSSKEISFSSVGKTKSGADMWLTKVETTFRFTDVDDGSYIEGTMPGQGSDTGDKGVYKAITGSIKYALSSEFLIASGDDPDEESAHNEPEYVQDETEPAKDGSCPNCKQGDLVEKQGKFGLFKACNRYPDCKFILK